MRNYLLIILTTICNSAVAQKLLSRSDKTFSYTLTIDSALTADSVNYDCVVKTIKISTRKNSKIVQTIIPGENYSFCGLPSDQILQIEDMNFDGYNDFRLLQFVPAAPNVPYYFWIYNPKTLNFQADTSLEKIVNPEFDPSTKTITSSIRAGAGILVSDTYKYIDKKITLIEEFELIVDNETGKSTEVKRKLVNGVLTEVSRTTE